MPAHWRATHLEIASAHPTDQTPCARIMNQIIYLIGLVVVIMAVLSFLGLR
jgi:hypothetical protein